MIHKKISFIVLLILLSTSCICCDNLDKEMDKRFGKNREIHILHDQEGNEYVIEHLLYSTYKIRRVNRR